MNTRQLQNVNQKVILKRIEILTLLEFTINWILFIMQEYQMHSWFFFLTIFIYLILNIVEIHILGYKKQIIPLHLLLICITFLLISLIITIMVYGLQYKLILLIFQIPILFLKIRFRSLALTGHQDRQQHIQLDTSHTQ
ncbi:unnamed protein product [Paramecium pentaurelia]|uniref:Transmembrane protein n=1 Tax=Paramecium pentaurelia TaxID=43138 RepID=A0A8S1UCW4_9CILI|nr:unnamed protein product [Paramecium pentaurelia]